MAFNRIVVLVDMDCFYVQVEQRRDPDKKGKPCAVVQYKKYRGGGIIAVGYEARAKGVTRMMMGDDAKAQCPEIHLFRVPESNGKANLDRYREAGAEVINVLSQFGGRVERASIDEAYIDLTEPINKIISEKKDQEYCDSSKLPNTHVVGFPEEIGEDEDKGLTREQGVKDWIQGLKSGNTENLRLNIAAVMTEEIRAAVYHQTGFRCSAGISYNKMLSKLACGINKPNKQTILPKKSVSKLFETMKIRKVRNLGGKLGKSLMEKFGIEFMGQIKDVPTEELTMNFGSKSSTWLREVCQGIDYEPVKERHLAQSIGCGKNFNGPDMLNTKAKVSKWMDALMVELSERLEKDKSANNRVARTLSVHLRLETGQSLSRSGPLLKYAHGDLLKQSLQLIRTIDTMPSKDERWRPCLTELSVCAKKFDTISGSKLSHTSPNKIKPGSATSETHKEFNKKATIADFCKKVELGTTSQMPFPDSSHVDFQSDLKNADINDDKGSKSASETCAVSKSKFFGSVTGKTSKNGNLKEMNTIAKFCRSTELMASSTMSDSSSNQTDCKSEMKNADLVDMKASKLSSDNAGVSKLSFFNSTSCKNSKNGDLTEAEMFSSMLSKSTTTVSPEIKFKFSDGCPTTSKDHAVKTVNTQHSIKKSSKNSIFQLFSQKNCDEVNDGQRKKSENVTPSKDNDVIIIGTEKPSKKVPKNSFFDSIPRKKKPVCKIDAMLMEEGENFDGGDNFEPPNFIHPLYGKIDREVFKDLPDDIREEIVRSYKITSSVIPSSQKSTSSTPKSAEKKNRDQQLISDFIPASQQSNSPKTSEIKQKRKSSGPSSGNSKKSRSSLPKKSPQRKNPNFTTVAKDTAVPLGFFRQRSQLTNAITKALAKEPPKFNP